MTTDEAADYGTRAEGQFFDRKSARIQPRDLARHLIAFANADGGTIVLGIEDDEKVTGISHLGNRENALIQAGMEFCSPPVRIKHRRVPCITAGGAADHLLVLEVAQSERLHARTDDKVFLRIGDQSRELGFEERLELHYDKGETNYEAVTAPEAMLDDLDATLLEEYRVLVGVRGLAVEALIVRGLASRHGDALAIRQAGVLLFGKQPTAWLPRAEIRVLRYEGTRAETGTRMNLVKDVTIDGPLPRQLQEAFRTIGAQLRGFTRLTAGGVFTTTPEYPEFAWQEALTNAVAHRSYSLYGARIEVRIFEDRMEVESPGRLPGIVRVQNIRDVHFSRNPRITRVLTDLGFVRDIGEGVDRMYDEMASAHLPPPEFREREHSVVVTLRRVATSQDGQPERESTPTRRVIDVPGSVARVLNPRQMAILRALRTQDRITTADVMRLFPTIGDRTASADLMGLVTLKLLYRVGKTRSTYYHTGGVTYLLPHEV